VSFSPLVLTLATALVISIIIGAFVYGEPGDGLHIVAAVVLAFFAGRWVRHGHF
jgi:uncharacterized membrane protein